MDVIVIYGREGARTDVKCDEATVNRSKLITYSGTRYCRLLTRLGMVTPS